MRERGVDVEVVHPTRHYGIAYGHGIVGNLRARPWLVLLVPAFLWNLRRAVPRDVDLIHAHWLAAGAVAATLRVPFVVQVWGTDVELARRVPWLARWILRRARLVVAASTFLAEQARALGARDVRVIPSGVARPETVGVPEEPPHVLYVGRLSPEKGIEDFLAATEGLPRVVVGAGPVRVPEAIGFVPPAELGRWYERAAVVCVPSRREGYGVVAREAMAWGRPVVATAVGGLRDLDVVLVPPGNRSALRTAVEELLGDAERRRELGSAARERAPTFEAETDALLEVYERTM